MITRNSLLASVKRIVIKVGTKVLTTKSNRLDVSAIEHIVEQICSLIEQQKKEVILVTSGAIVAGMQILGWEKRPSQLNKLQAAASVGQSRLMRVYERVFKEEGFTVGQILLTRDLFLSPERIETVRQTFSTLLKYKVVPIINENDSVAVEEIKFGDNDKLSALVTDIIGADLLLMLSDVDGLYDRDPKNGCSENIINEVKEINSAIVEIGKCGTPSDKGVGGIASKIEAAKYVTERGKMCMIANGESSWVIREIFEGVSVGTLFLPDNTE